MKIIEKGILSDGTEIQLEDWSEGNTKEYPDLYGLTIGAYPIAKNDVGYFIKKNDTFRLTISMNQYAKYTNKMVKADYYALLSDVKTLADLQEHFWNGDKDKLALGF